MKLIKDYMKKKSYLKEDVKKLNEDIDDDFEEDEDDDWEDEEDQEYTYSIELEIPCYVTATITTNKKLLDDEVEELVSDWIDNEEYTNGTASVLFYGDEVEDYDIESIQIDTDWIDKVTVTSHDW